MRMLLFSSCLIARREALNSTGRVTSVKSTAAEKSRMPMFISRPLR